MEKLINELVEKVGLSPDVAEKASKVVVDFVKTKLPAGLSEKAEELLQGKLDVSSIVSSLTSGENGVGGMFDKVKDIFSNK